MKAEPISIQIAYEPTAGGIRITRIQGRCAELRLPAEIDGLPVVAIGARAFATDAEAPTAPPEEERPAALSYGTAEADAAEGQALRRVFLPDGIETIGEYAFSGCTALEEVHLPAALREIPARLFDGCSALPRLTLPQSITTIEEYAFYGCAALRALRLPEGVTKIGKYAFYNCRRLEEINLPAAATELHTGLFLNCDALTRLSFGRCRHISDLISSLHQELHLTIAFPQADGSVLYSRLILPDYQYEYIEDTPARQFHQVNYGTGHIFRQCIGNSEIDFRRYDEIFYLTRREDAAATVLLLAMGRLEYPYRLQEARRETYLDYIRDHFLWAAEYFLRERQGEKLRLFAAWGLLTAENLPPLIDLAQRYGDTAAVSFLMDHRHRHFAPAPQKKTFDL